MMAGLYYTGGFIIRFHTVMNSYRLARSHSWIGRAATAYDAKYEALDGRLWILGGVLNELEGTKGHLEALLRGLEAGGNILGNTRFRAETRLCVWIRNR